ncbi:galactose-1-phosphate uridylyltransferase [bacterium]|nr:galactose-1-phosphate uridylyltransferase [candidate division CSSED10-310 bacterium]
MIELRKDPITGRWVIISKERGKRHPVDSRMITDVQAGFCPFCKGNEEHTPPPTLVYYDDPKTGAWSLRVVPNKFPALRIEGSLLRKADGMYDKMSGIGAHEVIIETPDHEIMLADMPVHRVRNVLQAYRDRILDLARDTRFRYILVFKNHGYLAGASQTHSHSQLIALPIIPRRVSEEIDGSTDYWRHKQRCVFCDILNREMEDRQRLICENSHFAAIAPYAPRCPFETWILPRIHRTNFEMTGDLELASLAELLSIVLRKLNAALETPPYNYLIHNAPLHFEDREQYHWHIEIMPIVTHVAGFEWGSGFYINPTPPEEAAAFLRSVRI